MIKYTLENAKKRYVYEKFHPREKVIPFSLQGKDRIIFNAPRPLCGDATWTGDFISGIFYAAVDGSDSEFAPRFIDENIKLDARVLTWVSEETLMGYAAEIAAEYNLTVTELMRDFDEVDLWSSYLDLIERETK